MTSTSQKELKIVKFHFSVRKNLTFALKHNKNDEENFSTRSTDFVFGGL